MHGDVYKNGGLFEQFSTCEALKCVGHVGNGSYSGTILLIASCPGETWAAGLFNKTVLTHGVMAATRTALDVNRLRLHGRAGELGLSMQSHAFCHPLAQ
jgi:hypothetical protein